MDELHSLYVLPACTRLDGQRETNKIRIMCKQMARGKLIRYNVDKKIRNVTITSISKLTK